MPTPWEAAVKASKQLTVSPGPDLLKSAAWGAVLFKKILDEFNQLSSQHKLGVTLVATTTPPDANGPGGANVQIEVSPGVHTFTINGKPRTGALISGIDIVGKTHTASQGGVILRSFIFVPINPTVGGPSSRGVGEGVKIALTLHEILHACGLHEDDPGHGPGANPDLFTTGGSLSSGSQPQNDKIDLGGGKFLPPFLLKAQTIGLIQRNWT